MTNLNYKPVILILNQMAGPMTWELAEDMGDALGSVALFTGHPDTLQKSHPQVQLFAAAPYQRGSFLRRALSWVRYWLQAFFWLWRWPKQTPLLLFSNPPILCWLGWLMGALCGTPYSVMVHDIYPDVLVRMSGFSEKHPLIRLWRGLNRHAYQRAQVVMTLGEYMAATLAQQFDATKTKQGRIEVIYPWVDTEKIKPIPKAENWFAQQYNQVDKLTVMYSGNMGLGHDIETIIEAVHSLQDIPGIQFMFVGSGPKKELVQQTVQDGAKNVILLDWVPEDIFPYSLATANVSIVSLETALNGLAIPSKAVYAMATGAYICAIADISNDLAKWVNGFSVGHIVKPGNARDLVSFLQNLQANEDVIITTSEIARNSSLKHFSRKHNTQKILNLLMKL